MYSNNGLADDIISWDIIINTNPIRCKPTKFMSLFYIHTNYYLQIYKYMISEHPLGYYCLSCTWQCYIFKSRYNSFQFTTNNSRCTLGNKCHCR